LKQPKAAFLKWLCKELELQKIKFRWLSHELSKKHGRYGQTRKGASASPGIRRMKIASDHDRWPELDIVTGLSYCSMVAGTNPKRKAPSLMIAPNKSMIYVFFSLRAFLAM
jgi:hypothetical protein